VTQATDIPVTCKIILNLRCQNFKQILKMFIISVEAFKKWLS